MRGQFLGQWQQQCSHLMRVKEEQASSAVGAIVGLSPRGSPPDYASNNPFLQAFKINIGGHKLPGLSRTGSHSPGVVTTAQDSRLVINTTPGSDCQASGGPGSPDKIVNSQYSLRSSSVHKEAAAKKNQMDQEAMLVEMRRVKRLVHETIAFLDAKRDARHRKWLISRQSQLDFLNNKPIDVGIIMKEAKKKIK